MYSGVTRQENAQTESDGERNYTKQRARITTTAQTKYAHCPRYRVTTDLSHFSVTLIKNHSSGTEVLAQGLIGTCAQM